MGRGVDDPPPLSSGRPHSDGREKMTTKTESTVLGESILDIVINNGRQDERVGGSSLNVAVGLTRLGNDVTFVTQLGEDRAGALIESHLAAAGVRVASGSISKRPTSVARAAIDDRGDASYDFSFTWDSASVALPPSVSGLLHLGAVASLSVSDHELMTRLAAMRPHNVISYDPNVRPALTGEGAEAAAAVERIVALADVVKVSTEDIRLLYGAVDLASVATAWILDGVGLVVITDGANGARAFARSSEVGVEASRVEKLTDTIGAGDAFMSGLLWALGSCGALQRESLHQIDTDTLARCLRIAATSAALAVEQQGANPPTLLALTERLRRDDAVDHARRYFAE